MPLLVTGRTLQKQLNRIETKVDLMSSQQDETNALAQQIQADVTAEAAALAQLKTMIGTATNLSALQAAVAALDTETAAEQAAAAGGP